jgi:hypothetical protein
MQVIPDSKYSLKDLYQQIDLFDRKIAYCQGYEKFETEEARAAAHRKLVTKRGALLATALAMAGRGVQCDPKYLPRSLKTAAATPDVAVNGNPSQPIPVNGTQEENGPKADLTGEQSIKALPPLLAPPRIAKRIRPARAFPPRASVHGQRTNQPAAAFDFGQKIKEAEAQELV